MNLTDDWDLFGMSVVTDPSMPASLVHVDLALGVVHMHPALADIMIGERSGSLTKQVVVAANTFAGTYAGVDLEVEKGKLWLVSVQSIAHNPLANPDQQTSLKTAETPTHEQEQTMGSATLNILKKKKAGDASAETPETEAAFDEGVETSEVEIDTSGEESAAEALVTSTDDTAKAPAKKPAKAKASTVTKAKAPAAKTEDAIESVAKQIENLTQDEAVTQLRELIDAQSFDEFRMGGILAKIQTEDWFGEHPNFRSFVEAEFNIKYRTAMYLVKIYKDLVESGVGWDKVKHLGWTKLKELSSILTLDNVDEVLKATAGMNTLQIVAYVDAFDGPVTKDNASQVSSDVETLKSMTFKLFEPQRESVKLAVEKAKKLAGTDSDAAALEFICIDFANNGGKKASAKAAKVDINEDSLLDAFKAIRASHGADGLEAPLNIILTAMNDAYPEANISVELTEEASA